MQSDKHSGESNGRTPDKFGDCLLANRDCDDWYSRSNSIAAFPIPSEIKCWCFKKFIRVCLPKRYLLRKRYPTLSPPFAAILYFTSSIPPSAQTIFVTSTALSTIMPEKMKVSGRVGIPNRSLPFLFLCLFILYSPLLIACTRVQVNVPVPSFHSYIRRTIS